MIENALNGLIPKEFLEAGRRITEEHKAQYKGVYHMKGGFLGEVLSSPILAPVLDAVAVVSGNPELIPLINAGTATAGGLVTGQGVGQSLESGALAGGEAFAGQEIAPALGNAFADVAPDTAASLGIGGGANSLTDLLGQTTGGGSLAGVGTIGGDLTGNFAGGSGLDSLFGNTSSNLGAGVQQDFATGLEPNGAPQLTSSLDASAPGVSGAATTDPSTNLARLDTATAAAQPAAFTNSFASGTGAPAIGGGTSGGFADISPTQGAGTLADLFSRGLASPNDATTGLSDNFSTAAANELPSSVYNPVSGFNLSENTNSGGSQMPTGLSQLYSSSGLSSPGSMINNLLRTGLTAAGTNTNQAGYQGEANAATQAAANYQPFLNTGTQANQTLSDLYGNNGAAAATTAQNNFANTPGYQFVKNQGINALDASAAAKGQLLSGNQSKALEDYGSGLASTTYNQYVQNLQNQANAGLSAAGGVGTGEIGAASAQAQGGQAKANVNNQLYGGLANALFPDSMSNNILKLLTSGGNNQGLLALL